MQCERWYTLGLAKASFNLELNEVTGSSIPAEVLRRCTGKQSPAAPHRQRLLVASAKAAKAEKGDPNNNGKTKPSSKNSGGNHPESEVAEKAEPKKRSKRPTEDDKPKEKTPYAIAKESFMEKSLGSSIVS